MTTMRRQPALETRKESRPVASEAPAASASATATVAMSDPARFLNREVQWLEFNDRVLQLAADERTPLLERVRFLSIFASNLDEFFMKRVGGLRRQIHMGVTAANYDGVDPITQLRMIRERVIPLTLRKAEIYRESLLPALREKGIHLLRYDELSPDEKRMADDWFNRSVFPVLTPLAVDPGHRFPFISNLSVSVGVLLKRPDSDERLFARVKVPEGIPLWHQLGDSLRFVQLQRVIENNLDKLFPGMEILSVVPFRVTRNADVESDHEDAEDLLDLIQQQLRERRFAPVVRLQVRHDADREVLNFLVEEMQLHRDDVYETRGIIDFRSLDVIANLNLPDMRYPAWTPAIPTTLQDTDKDIFSIIRKGDVLVHHPYESFDASVERFIEEAVRDPNVLCIKQTLYRTSGDSPFIHELVKAADQRKQVAVLVEVRARFDEARNITWARRLEDAGVHVAYGVVGLKTHTKIALVVRKEGAGIRCYAHIGTGNYNSSTAKIYEDLGLFTCDPVITQDVVELFNYLTGRSRQTDYDKLLVAPVSMKRKFLEMIQREAELAREGAGGRIIAKMNQLQDQETIDALYRASQAGVQIDLIVRGFCTLRPGVSGLSENIRVSSILGRFLEHSRIFYFRNGQEDPLAGRFFIGSADWMYRNLHARVEATTPIEDRNLRRRLWEILQINLNDRRQVWDMTSDGRYQPRSTQGLGPSSPLALGSHQVLMDGTLQRVREAINREG
jgi:polyphosphate kinase